MSNLEENKLIVKFKKLDSAAKMPSKMRSGDSAYDLYSIEDGEVHSDRGVFKFRTGIAIEIPEGYVGLIWCRGGKGMDGLDVHGGVIDSNYRGEIIVGLSQHVEKCFFGFKEYYHKIKSGDRIAQLIIQKSEDVEFVEVDMLDQTDRGSKGFGSSDKFYNKNDNFVV